MRILMLLGFSALIFLPFEVRAQQCPDDHRLTRATITQWLWSTDEAYEWMRNKYAVPRMDSTAIRVLDDATDAVVCTYFRTSQGFNANINAQYDDGSPEDYVTFYQAGSYYFAIAVVAPHPDPNVLAVGLTGVHLYDEMLNRLGGFGF